MELARLAEEEKKRIKLEEEKAKSKKVQEEKPKKKKKSFFENMFTLI